MRRITERGLLERLRLAGIRPEDVPTLTDGRLLGIQGIGPMSLYLLRKKYGGPPVHRERAELVELLREAEAAAEANPTKARGSVHKIVVRLGGTCGT